MLAPCTPHHHEPVLRLFLSIRTRARSVFRLSHHRKLLSDLSNVQRSVGTFQVFKCWGSSRLAGATSSSALWEKNVSIFDLVWSHSILGNNVLAKKERGKTSSYCCVTKFCVCTAKETPSRFLTNNICNFIMGLNFLSCQKCYIVCLLKLYSQHCVYCLLCSALKTWTRQSRSNI